MILTGLCTIVICLLLFFFGGGPLHTFALTLFIGFIVGTYSSVYVASAVIIEWDAVRPHKFKL